MTIGPDIFIDNRVISKRLINIYKDSDKKIGINYIEKQTHEKKNSHKKENIRVKQIKIEQ